MLPSVVTFFHTSRLCALDTMTNTAAKRSHELIREKMSLGHSIVSLHMTRNMAYNHTAVGYLICIHCEHLFIIHLFKYSEQLVANLTSILHTFHKCLPYAYILIRNKKKMC